MTAFRDWLDEQGLSVPVVARATGLGVRQLYAVSAGHQQITRRQVDRLVGVYGVDPRRFGPVNRGPGRRWWPDQPQAGRP